ncbi:ABC transporter substrate-binding protein [Streptomyces niveus]|uniref:ABC transporter substrate-binding protein n=1 Tax=Streptomyces niveus TaxID=193462 RepID=UPI003F53E7D9
MAAGAAGALLVIAGAGYGVYGLNGSNDDNKSDDAGIDAGLTSIVNKSAEVGGTVTFEHSKVPDSLDPGNTYNAWVQNFSRLYGRTLTTFKPAAGKEGLEVVPDLAESLGKASADAKTWTYKLRKGVKFDDGSPVTSQDVKYAIERSNFAPEVLSQGPTYFKAYLVGGEKYQGPYKDKSPGGLESIETPDDRTIVFELNKPLADFDYLATSSQTAPVPQAKDTGAEYVKQISSSGPYKFQSYGEGRGATLVRNPHWDQDTDPIRPALADRITITFKVDPTTVDQHLMSDNITVDAAGTGLQATTRPKVVTKESERTKTDNPYAGATSYLALSTKVEPFDNADCRKAVHYAIDKASVQTALGGDTKGDVASTLLPPTVNGYQKFDLYRTEGNKGDIAKAKDALTRCGKPNGFKTNLTARSDRPDEVQMATAIQASLKKVGIQTEIKQYPSVEYFSDFAGVPSYVKKHDLGMMMMAWGAEWPTGFGFLDQIVNGSAIRPSSSSNLMELDDPKINKALSDGIAQTDATARAKAWGEVDKLVLENASAVPLIYRRNLLYRPDSATNVTVTQAYSGMYDYLLIGSTS